MSFTTGRAQRRGTAAATVGTSNRHVGQTPYPSSDILRQPPGPTRAHVKRRRVSSIGEDGATGLIIHGSHEIDPMEGRDPNSATPPLSGIALSNPDFPISYNGRGTMKFVSPIRITTIDGPLNVNGEVYSSSGLLAGATDDVAIWDVQVGESLADGDLNFTKDAANSYATYARTNDHVSLHVHYVWSDKGSTVGTKQLTVKNLPFGLEDQIHKAVVHPTNITATQLGSYFVADGQPFATELKISTADSATGIEVPSLISSSNTTGTLSFLINYHALDI